MVMRSLLRRAPAPAVAPAAGDGVPALAVLPNMKKDSMLEAAADILALFDED